MPARARACLPYEALTVLMRVEGKRRVPFVRTRACAARLAAVTYIRARAYNLFLAGVSQPPDALFGTTRCHAPVPPPSSFSRSRISPFYSWHFILLHPAVFVLSSFPPSFSLPLSPSLGRSNSLVDVKSVNNLLRFTISLSCEIFARFRERRRTTTFDSDVRTRAD